jgi:hypothetical protein
MRADERGRLDERVLGEAEVERGERRADRQQEQAGQPRRGEGVSGDGLAAALGQPATPADRREPTGPGGASSGAQGYFFFA